MKNIVLLIIAFLPVFGFSQEHKLKGKYTELSTPAKVRYKFKNNYFWFHAKTDVAEISGKGKYKIKKDSLLLCFDKYSNHSMVNYNGQRNIHNITNRFQINVIEESSKTGFVGAKVRFLAAGDSLVYECFLNEDGKIDIELSEGIKAIKISYIGYPNLILNVDSCFNDHEYFVLWKTARNIVIDGEIRRYKISNRTRRRFYLERGDEVFKYRRCLV